MVLTRTGEMAHVVLPAAASWCEDEGTVTSSERRVQRVRKALEPPGTGASGPRDPRRARPPHGRGPGQLRGREAGRNELRKLSPWHAGMSYARLEENNGLQWPCPDESHPGTRSCTGVSGTTRRRATRDLRRHGARSAGRSADRRVPDPPDQRAPARLLQHRVQTGGYTSPLRRGESLDISPEDGARLGIGTARPYARCPAAGASPSRRATTRRCGRGSRS